MEILRRFDREQLELRMRTANPLPYQSQNPRSISNLAISINALESGKQPVATLIATLSCTQISPSWFESKRGTNGDQLLCRR